MLIDDADLKLDPAKVRRFLQQASPSERMVYFVGNLAEERHRDRRLADVARAAYEAAEEGSCRLFQKRFGQSMDGHVIYMIEKR